MPIIYVCSDGKNSLIKSLYKTINDIGHVDTLYCSSDMETQDFADSIRNQVKVNSHLMLVDFNSNPEKIFKRVKIMITQQKQGNFIIVCKKEMMKYIHVQDYEEWDSETI